MDQGMVDGQETESDVERGTFQLGIITMGDKKKGASNTRYARPHLDFAAPASSPWTHTDKECLERV